MTKTTTYVTMLAALGVLLHGSTASAQVFGTFTWQMQPYCNQVTLTITQIPSGYTIDGFDDGCGAPKQASANGQAHINPDGTVGLNFTIGTAPAALGIQVAASLNVATANGSWTDSAGNGGTLVLGAATPGLPVRPVPAGDTRAASPCRTDNTAKRFYDCGNGTVTDAATGLTWLKDASCLGSIFYAEANQKAAALGTGQCGLTDGSLPGDWRLASKAEWQATIARAVALGCVGAGAPTWTDDAGTACYGTGAGSSITGLTVGTFWTSTTYDVNPGNAWYADLGPGVFNDFLKTNGAPRVWAVRGELR